MSHRCSGQGVAVQSDLSARTNRNAYLIAGRENIPTACHGASDKNLVALRNRNSKRVGYRGTVCFISSKIIALQRDASAVGDGNPREMASHQVAFCADTTNDIGACASDRNPATSIGQSSFWSADSTKH